MTDPLPAGSTPDIGAYENELGSPLTPPSPSNLIAESGNQAVTLSWERNGFTGTTLIQRSITSGSDYVTIGTSSGNTFVNGSGDFTPVNQTIYYYRVASTNGLETLYSDEVSANPEMIFTM